MSCLNFCMHLCLCVFASARCPVHFCSAVCVRPLAAVLSEFYPRLFSNLVRFNMHTLSSAPLLEMSLRQRKPHTLQVPFVFPPLRPCFGESNLLLTETSATMKVSPIGRVVCLKGFACILEAGLGNTLGCHMCHPGMRQNG